MERTTLITGASSGIGRALAYEFAGSGSNLILVASNEKKLKRAALEIGRNHPRIRIKVFAKDLTIAANAHQIFDELHAQGVFVDTLVNDAGVGVRGRFADVPLERQLDVIRLNVEALTRLTYLFLQPMISNGEGRILNLGSIAGFEPGPLLAVYHATKAFVVSFSEALAEELKDTNIKVTCLCPGATDTDFFARADMLETNIYKSGMLMEPAKVAREGYQALKSGDRIHVPGVANKALTFMRRVSPLSAQAKVNKKFYENAGDSKS